MNNDDKYTPVRFSHLTTFAGVGAMVRDSNDFIMVVADTRFWKNKHGDQTAEPIYFVERIKKHLKITKNLAMPPSAQVGKDKIIGHPLPAVVFPGYMLCKKCNTLHHKPWNGIEKEITKDLVCSKCNQASLEQVTWCAISSNGDLMDVPWYHICHSDSGNKCEPDPDNLNLEIIAGNKGRKVVRCTKCSARHVFEQSDTKYFTDNQPWINSFDKDADLTLYTIMEINDPRVYSVNKQSAIVIPPESNIDKSSILYKLSCDSLLLRKLEEHKSGFKRKRLLVSAADIYRCSVNDIEDALREIEAGQSDLLNITAGEMYNDEYKALSLEENYKDGFDFVTRHKSKLFKDYIEELNPQGELKKISQIINELVAVNRLRVIEVFKGFSRFASDSDEKEKVVIPPDITGDLDWLPAIELFGEGVFFTLDSAIINRWESIPELKLRASEIAERYENSPIEPFDNLKAITPRFILLHTLAHLVIRELEISGGYPAASLKERVYSSQADDMAGILIYTAVPDIAGSLGGIVEAAEPKNFIKLIAGAFKHAQWCSLDPVCTEHEGQGPSWLNRAACHACALIPETSCEYDNVFLDRIFIKGNNSVNIPPLLSVIGDD